MSKSTSSANHGRPHTSSTNPQQRRVRLLGWIIVTLIFILTITLVIVILTNRNDSCRLMSYAVIILCSLCALGITYWINRSGHHSLAAHLTVLFCLLAQWASILFEPQVSHEVIRLSFVVIPILLCSMFLSTGHTIVLVVFQFTAMVLLALFDTALQTTDWLSLFVFSLVVSSVVIVSNVVTQRDLEQIDKQTLKLLNTEAQLRVISIKDSVSGLFNRYYMEEELEKALEKSRKNKRALAILMLDVDHFKQINDTYGHIAGDAILKKAADVMQKHIRSSDIACRFGGDEFVIILPETTQEVAFARANTIHQKIKELSFESEDCDLKKITLSIGLAAFPQHGETSNKLLSAADAALYQAKREGRDRVIVAQPLPQDTE